MRASFLDDIDEFIDVNETATLAKLLNISKHRGKYSPNEVSQIKKLFRLNKNTNNKQLKRHIKMKLARKLHPDKYKGEKSEHKKWAEMIFKSIYELRELIR